MQKKSDEYKHTYSKLEVVMLGILYAAGIAGVIYFIISDIGQRYFGW